MEAGEVMFGRDLVFKFGLMELDIKEIGFKIKQMVKENLFMLMEIFMMAIGSMIKLLVKEHIIIVMVQNTKGNG